MDTTIGPIARLHHDDGGGSALAVGCFASICRGRLGDRLVAFAQRCPAVDIGVQEMARSELLAGARDGALALAVLPGGPRQELCSTRLWDDRAMLAMAPGHRLAALPAVPAGELLRERLLISRQRYGGEMHRFLARQVAPLVQLNGVLCNIGLAQMMEQVAAGDGVALTCESHGEVGGEDVVLRPVAAKDASFPVSAYWRGADPRWPLSTLIEVLSAVADSRASGAAADC